MLSTVKDFIDSEKLFYAKNKVILAVSGGLDSMVLLDVLSQMELELIVAHCNFELRGGESDEDQKNLTKVVKEKYPSVKFETINFDTTAYAKENKISIQIAARDLRYNWFETLRKKHQAQVIATAHHLNDNTETLLFNLSNGAGIKGIRGMLPKNDKIVRPFLERSRTEIETYAKENAITYREDSSNASLKYNRNLIRNKVVPELEKVNANFEKTQRNHFERFRDIADFYETVVDSFEQKLFEQKNDDFYVSTLKLFKVKGFKTLLFEILSKYGFNAAQVEDLIAVLDKAETKTFFAGNYRIITTKKHFVLSDLSIEKQNLFELNEKTTKIKLPNKTLIQVHLKPKAKLTKMSNKAHYSYLDADKLAFPLVLRRWKDGDYFYPFGMYSASGKAKKKKLKKYFMDMKFSLIDKENTWVLSNGDKIVCLINQRIDDRFKITDDTKNVLQLKFVECKN